MSNHSRQKINLRIILQSPNQNVVFGIQKGSGNNYETILKQQYESTDFVFDVEIDAKNTGEAPDFAGPFVQGPKGGRFIYVDIGTYAGQHHSEWGRRLKIPLTGISKEMVTQLLNNANLMLQTAVPGKGKDGGPNCATVKPFDGWKISNR